MSRELQKLSTKEPGDCSPSDKHAAKGPLQDCRKCRHRQRFRYYRCSRPRSQVHTMCVSKGCRPVLWCGSLSHRLWCWHPVWALVQVPAAPLLILLPANVPEKEQQQMAREFGPLPPMWETRMKLLALALSWPSPGHCGHLGSETADGRSLLVSLPPLNCAFQINKYILK